MEYALVHAYDFTIWKQRPVVLALSSTATLAVDIDYNVHGHLKKVSMLL